jgi:hypothetical protein
MPDRSPDPRDDLHDAARALSGLVECLGDFPGSRMVSAEGVHAILVLIEEKLAPAEVRLRDYVPRSMLPPHG